MTIQLNMDKKILAIGILSLTAVGLLVANFVSPPKAQAAFTIRGEHYTATTGRINSGGEALYLTNRDGLMAVFAYSPNTSRLEYKGGRSVIEMFNGGAAAGPQQPNGGRRIRP